MSQSLLSVVFISLISSAQAAQAISTCWYPDEKTTEGNHVPCNQTTSVVSACCDPIDSCSTSGLCLGRSGWVYRGSCTDQSWGSPNCPRECKINPNTNSPFGSFTPLLSCAKPGTKQVEYCCAFDDEVSCCNSSFLFPGTGTAFKAGDDALQSSLKLGATATITITTAASIAISATTAPETSNTKSASNPISSGNSAIAPPPEASNTKSNTNPVASENSDLGTKLGLGIGVPLGILVLGLLALLFWWIKRKSSNGIHTPMNSHNNGVTAGAYSDVYRQTSEMPVPHHQPQYLPGPNKPIYEAPSQV